jgi:DNA-binding XRE family transcriptional regulator
VSRQTVISIESGRYLPSLPLALRIARLFDLTVDKLASSLRLNAEDSSYAARRPSC